MSLSSFPSSVPGPDNVPQPEALPPLPRRRRPVILVLVGAFLALLAGAAAYLGLQRGQPAPQTAGGGAAAVPVVAVSVGDVHSTVRISGTIVAERSAIIRAPRIMGSRGDFNRGGGGAHGPGGGGGGHPDFTLTLLSLAKAGSRVKAGDVVAQFDPENQNQRLDDYNDSVVRLKNSIRKMTANLAASKEEHEQRVRTAYADWQKSLLDVKTVKVRSEIDAEKMRLTAEEMDLKHKMLVKEQALVEESQQASIRTSQLTLAQSAIEVERARNNVKRMSMTAPIDGIVVMANVVLNGELRTIRAGDEVAAGQPVLYVVDTSSMILDGIANQVDADRLRIGYRATVHLDAYPDASLKGSVIGIGAMAKVSRFRASYLGEIPVRLRIQERDARLLPDLTGSAEVVLHSESNVLVAPRPALFTENGQHFVFVQDGGGWTRKPVVTGVRSGTHVAIRAGLQAGDRVAIERPL